MTGATSKFSQGSSEPKAHSSYCSYPPLPHFTCGTLICSSARWMRQLHPWYAHNISGVSLGHHQAQTPTPALKETTFHQPISATFICPWSFLPWPQKLQLCTRLLRQRLYINARALVFLFQKQSIDSCLKVSLNSLSLLGTRLTGSHKRGLKRKWNTS